MALPIILVAANEIRKVLEPQKPTKGPPLPRVLGIKWPTKPKGG